MKKIEKIENTYEEEVELQELSFSLSLFVKMPSSNNLTGKALVQIMVTVNGFFREPARPCPFTAYYALVNHGTAPASRAPPRPPHESSDRPVRRLLATVPGMHVWLVQVVPGDSGGKLETRDSVGPLSAT